MNKLISIIMPVKNGENYLVEAIDGIKKQNMNVEIIVIDDGSNDKTSEIAKNIGCRIIKHETSLGPVISKNDALKFANGEYIMFHDHDDIMIDGALMKLYNEIESNVEISAVMAKVQDFISPEILEEEKQKIIIRQEAYYGLFTGAILIKKSVFDKIGLFNEYVTAGEIIDWKNRMNENKLKIKKIDLISTNRRIHNGNFGRTAQKTEFKDYSTLLRAKLGRK